MTTITATKGEFVNLVNGLYSIRSLKGKEFGFKVLNNLELLQSSLKDLEDLGRPSDEFLKVAEKMNAIANRNSPEGVAETKTIEEENEELITIRKTQMEDVKIVMEEETSIELELIEKALIPDEISVEELMNINKIIQE
jgi:hypothetical protein